MVCIIYLTYFKLIIMNTIINKKSNEKCKLRSVNIMVYIYIYLLEIDRYIGLPIFFPIFKHFTIIGFVKKKKKKKKKIGFDIFFICHIHNCTEYNQQ